MGNDLLDAGAEGHKISADNKQIEEKIIRTRFIDPETWSIHESHSDEVDAMESELGYGSEAFRSHRTASEAQKSVLPELPTIGHSTVLSSFHFVCNGFVLVRSRLRLGVLDLPPNCL